MIGEHAHAESLAVVLHEQTDVAQCVTLTLSSRTKDANIAGALLTCVSYGLGQVVGFLFGYVMNEVRKASAYFVGKRIAIPNDGGRNAAFSHETIGSAVTTDYWKSALQHCNRKWVCGIIAVGKDDDFLHGDA